MTLNHWYYPPMSYRPFIDVAVVMRRERVQGDMAKWQTWRWVLDDVTPQEENSVSYTHLTLPTICSV